MDIVCSTDSNYVMPTGVMLTSLFENNKGDDIRVHLLHNGISERQIKNIETVADRYGQTVCFYRMDDASMDYMPVGQSFQRDHVGLSRATYYRLFLARILPESVRKAVYFDGDIIVTSNLRILWDINMDGNAVAAVPDSYNNVPLHYNRLRYPQAKGYFNAGVLLINLEYWRRHNVVDKFVDYIVSNKEKLACHDQDVLNFIFQDDKVELPLKYNMQNEYWFDTRYNVLSWQYEEQMREGQRHPVVVHFTGIPKPWYSNCRHPYKLEFDRYKAMTPWKDCKQKRWMPLKYVLEKTFIKAVVLMGLRRRDYIDKNNYIRNI